MKRLLLLLSLFSVISFAQISGGGGVFTAVSSDPTGACTGTRAVYNPSTGNQFSCLGGTWTKTNGGGGTGLSTLNGQTGASQSFGNDTNVTMSSGSNLHTLTWVGTLAKSRQNAATVYTDASQTFSGINLFSGNNTFSGNILLTGNSNLYTSGGNASVDLSGAVAFFPPRVSTQPSGSCIFSYSFETWSSAPAGNLYECIGGVWSQISGGTGGVQTTAANAYSAGAKQTFTAGTTTAGINIAPTGLPSALVAGDLFYYSPTSSLYFTTGSNVYAALLTQTSLSNTSMAYSKEQFFNGSANNGAINLGPVTSDPSTTYASDGDVWYRDDLRAVSYLDSASVYHRLVSSITSLGTTAGKPLCTDANGNATIAGCATGPVLSGVSSFPASTTISASWNTDLPSDSNLQCGTVSGTYTITAVDAHTETAVNVHQAIVAGLAPSTTYYCVASSTAYGGGTGTSTQFTVATSAAPASTPITNYTVASWGYVGSGTTDGDTFYNQVCADQNDYTELDDTHGFGKTGSADMMIGRFTNETTFAGVNVNFLAGYGPSSSSHGSDSQGYTRSNKMSGLLCMGGNMYALMGRQNTTNSSFYPVSGITGLFEQEYGSLLMSKDLGLTWNSVTAPNNFASFPYPPAQPTQITTYFADKKKFGAPSFVTYGVDDGTLGYFSPTCDAAVTTVTATCRVDNADAYVYILGNDGFWNNGSNLYLSRIARAKLAKMNGNDIQYYTNALGDGNGLEDGNWSSSISSVAVLLNAPGQIGEPAMQYIPYLNRYVLLNWYYPNCNTGSSNAGCPQDNTTAGNSVFNFYDAPHPWGPFTPVGSISSFQAASGSAFGSMPATSGLYNPTLLHRTAVTSTSASPQMTLLTGGNFYLYTPNYTINYANIVFNPAAPTAPASLTPTPSSGSVGLSWAASTGFGLNYNLYRSTSSGFTPGSGNLLAANLTTTTYNDSAVSNGTPYYYAVDALNSAGTSSYATGSATPVFVGLLDSVCPGTNCPQAGAWSVARQLRSAYSGNLILIRRASDGTTQAVGNDGNGNVNQSTITTFCSGTTCGVDTFYDQSGTSFNLVSSTTTVASTCVLYQSGAILTKGGRSACSLSGATAQAYLATGESAVLNTLSAEAMAVSSWSASNPGYGTLMALSDGTHSESSSTQGIDMMIGNNAALGYAAFHDAAVTSAITLTANTLYWLDTQYNNASNANKTTLFAGASSTAGSVLTGSTTALASTEVGLGLSPAAPAGTYFVGTFSEAYVWNKISGQASAFHTNVSAYYGVQ